MIITYQKFLKESENNWTEKDPEYWGITNYKWRGEYLDCFQDVILYDKDIIKIPFKFGIVEGTFDCSDNKSLESLEGSPIEVTGSYFCNETDISILDGCPKMVGGSFYEDKYHYKNITDYPLCIIMDKLDTRNFYFREIHKIVKNNVDIFKPLLDDKVGFHQMVMRIEPEMIQYYKNSGITAPSKKTILMNL